ncbi:MAG: hypothetical protein J0H74_11610 [Chitinophagaceae bacterium]|nr:hypothetical protein [Chitinophagaceae bacterium]
MIRPTILFLLLAFTACQNRQARRNYLFDMGSDHTSPAKGYTAVTPTDTYNPARGFGWLTPPAGTFDSVNIPLPQDFLKKGVLGKDSMVFRVDLPEDDYFITLTLGTPPSDTSKIIATVNGQPWPDTLTTPWFRLAFRTLRKKIHIVGGQADIKVRTLSGPNVGIYAIDVRPVTGKKDIPFDTPLDEDTAAVSRFRTTLLRQLEKDPADLPAINQLRDVDNYLQACADFDGGGWSWAVKSTHMSLIYRLYAAVDLLEQVIADSSNPLYDRSVYLLARIYYWLHQEDDELYSGPLYDRYFQQLEKKYPGNKLIRMYMGEKFYDTPDFDTTAPKNAPRWAVLQHEAMLRLQKLIHWWVLQKQTPNGEMGGKYGDDVELLRTWLPAILGADDSIAALGYTRLADGVWHSDALDKGFASRIDDVEHSAELFRDTHPAMFLMHYGDPEYVERCLISMQHFTNTWTGMTRLGHRHFKSYYLSSTEVLADSLHGIDVALNARAVHPGLWALWYNHNPSLLRSFSEWSNAWIADAQRTDNDKPAGILPSAIAFATERPGGNSAQWYDPQLAYDYYRWDHIEHVNELQRHLLGMYDITGDRRFLQPAEFYATLMQNSHTSPSTARPGSLDWVRYQLSIGGTDHETGVNPMGKLFAMARQITSSPLYDSLVATYGEPYSKYLVTATEKDIDSALQQMLTGLRYNFPMLTSEVKFTDRVYVPGGDILTGMYTGHFGAGYEYPALTATWKHTGPDIAIFVRRGSGSGASISLFNFGAPKTVTLRTWQLKPGRYVVATSADNTHTTSQDTVDIKERVSDIPLFIPAGKNILVEIRQLRPAPASTIDAPDIALAERDIILTPGTGKGKPMDISCRIHNIGRLTAKNITVTCFVDNQKIKEAFIPALDAPNDLVPKSTITHFTWTPSPGSHHIRISATLKTKEITLLNNAAARTFTAN